MRFLLALLLASLAQAQPTAYVGGQWWTGDRFEARDTTWADGGVFVPGPLAGAVRVVEMGRQWVVPPFGDAHYHGLDGPDYLATADSQFVAEGIFYVQNPNNLRSDRDRVRGMETVVDVAYANGGITAPGAHPVPAYESRALGLTIADMWGPRAAEIRASRLADGDAYHLALTPDDLDSVWPRVLAGRPDIIKVYLLRSEQWADGTPDQPLGLSPAVVAGVVRRAHAAGLRVVAHVETAADARAALAAGVDVLAHVPGYGLNAQDPAMADSGAYVMDDALLADLAQAHVPVTPTLARALPALRFTPERYRPDSTVVTAVGRFHRNVYRQLAGAGVPVAFGADAAGSLTARDEAAYAVEIGGLTPAQALHALSTDTPRAIFPDRAIGQLADGFEASLLALACDPIQDWSCTAQITHREKQGLDLDMARTAQAWRDLEVATFTAPPAPADGSLLAGLRSLTWGDHHAADASLRAALAAAPDSLRPFVRARLAEAAAERFDWAESVAWRLPDDAQAETSVASGFARFPRPRLAMAGPEATVPFEGLRIPVSVNGAPARAIVDTGAPGTGIGRRLVERLGLRVDTTARGISRVPSMGLEFEVYAVLIDSIQVGRATLYNVPATVGWTESDPDTEVGDPDAEADEIFLGADILRHLAGALRYDYADSTFTIVRDVPRTGEPPTFLIDGRSAPVVPVTVAGQRANAIVDTGNQRSVYLARGAFDLGSQSVTRSLSGDGWNVDFYDLSFEIPGHPDGSHEAYEATFLFSANDSITAILGRPVWAGGALTVDFVNRQVRFDGR